MKVVTSSNCVFKCHLNTRINKTGLQPVSRPVEQDHYLGGMVKTHFDAKSVFNVMTFGGLLFSYVVYSNQQMHACACIRMIENNKKRSKIIKNILFSSCIQEAHSRLT